MSVIVELSLPAAEFELGRILAVEDDASVTLETMVPLGDRSIPFFRLRDSTRGSFERTVSQHAAVEDIHAVNTHDGETLYALDWEISGDAFLAGVGAMEGYLLAATGTAETWGFELRFPSHEALSAFQEHCANMDVDIDVERIYNPTRPDAGPWYGLTPRQREVLVRAVEAGYYSIPRRISTKELAEEFDISDQAVTERLRRAIDTLVANTLVHSTDTSGHE